MSTSTTVRVGRTHTAPKRLLMIAALVTALLAGVFAAYTLATSTPVAETAPATVDIADTGAAAEGCLSDPLAGAVGGTCGHPGGGVQPGDGIPRGGGAQSGSSGQPGGGLLP